jgi:hypothetical protein
VLGCSLLYSIHYKQNAICRKDSVIRGFLVRTQIGIGPEKRTSKRTARRPLRGSRSRFAIDLGFRTDDGSGLPWLPPGSEPIG